MSGMGTSESTGGASRQSGRTGQHTFGGVMVVGWIVFFVLLVWFPQTFADIWTWVISLPLWAEVIVWIVLLPWMVGAWIWKSDLAEWQRITLVAIVALLWIVASARPASQGARR